MTDRNQTLQMVEISKINILNPRERNLKIAGEIRKNIESVGLKRPITVARLPKPSKGYEYDLVCGQGRLEAYIANNQKEIPAIVIDATEEESLVMSLVENYARRQHRPHELLAAIRELRDVGYGTAEISVKTGLGKDYINQIIHLLDKGEERLVNAVENERIPLKVAIEIAGTPDSEMQNVLQEAYEKDLLRGSRLAYTRELIERRRKKGKHAGTSKKGQKRMSALDMQKIYRREIDRKKLFVRRAEKLENTMIFVVQSLKRLLADGNFMNLLKAEKLDSIPAFLAERMAGHG